MGGKLDKATALTMPPDSALAIVPITVAGTVELGMIEKVERL